MRVMHHLPGVQASTGCTEPAAVALAAALAARAAGGAPWWVTVACDPGTYQNGLLTGVPGCGGRGGLQLAAALGAFAGDPERALEVLAGFRPDELTAALDLVARDGVGVVRRGTAGLSILARVETDQGTGEAHLAGDHLSVVRHERDGAPWPLPRWATLRALDAPRPTSLVDVLALADSLDGEDQDLLLSGLARNVETARGALDRAHTLDGPETAAALAEAASRARMTGARVSVTTSGWSGNQGLVATLPLHALGARASAHELARALATSHLVGQLLREGAPSPLCHALLAASAGAAAGCVRLLGGDAGDVARACSLVVASVGPSGCDGAKPGCALRVGLAAAQAVRCARRALEAPADAVGGLVGQTLEETALRIAGAAAVMSAPPQRP